MIGELGMHGINPDARFADRVFALRSAQYNACNKYAEFQSTTAFVPTAIYAVVNDTVTYESLSHYYGRADTIYYIGQAMGKGMSNLIKRDTNTTTQETIPPSIRCDTLLVCAFLWVKRWIGNLIFEILRKRIL